MKTHLKLAVLALLLATASTRLSTALAQGSLTPSGAPAASMKSLDQIYARTDSRIPITNSASAVTISVPGSYYLTTNLTVSFGNAITIATNGVTLDLNGYTISSTAANALADGITLNSGISDITIANGHIHSGVTNNGTGIYSGTGFGYGIISPNSAPVNVLVSRVSVSGCAYHGIYLNNTTSSMVENCTVQTMGGYGIFASTIKSCYAKDCGYAAILGDQVSDSRGESVNSYGISASTVQNSYGTSGSYFGLYATTAQNCFGSSSSYYGIYADNALNCYGFSGSSYGLYAVYSAIGCTGYCNGSSYGIYAYKIAQNCYGFCSSGIGLYAFMASACNGATSTGTALSTTHNINSF